MIMIATTGNDRRHPQLIIKQHSPPYPRNQKLLAENNVIARYCIHTVIGTHAEKFSVSTSKCQDKNFCKTTPIAAPLDPYLIVMYVN